MLQLDGRRQKATHAKLFPSPPGHRCQAAMAMNDEDETPTLHSGTADIIGRRRHAHRTLRVRHDAAERARQELASPRRA